MLLWKGLSWTVLCYIHYLISKSNIKMEKEKIARIIWAFDLAVH
jgi:hypothetical protein